MYSVTSEDSHREESHLSSKPTLSDIYERSDEDRESRLTNKHTPPVKSSGVDRSKLSRENLDLHDSKLKPALKVDLIFESFIFVSKITLLVARNFSI